MRDCLGCGSPIESTNRRKVRCKPDCGRKRNRPRGHDTVNQRVRRQAGYDAHELDFVAVDGEGVTLPNGEHRYVALSVGNRTLQRNGEHLQFPEIAAFLWDCFLESPDAVFVGFFLGYDYAQWTRTLPESRGRMLFSPAGIAARKRSGSGGNPVPFPVRYGDWEFDMHAGKRFKLRQSGSRSWLYINDAGGFFQESFLGVINPKKWDVPVCTPAEYALIVAGKERRATAVLDADMVRYNTLENDILERVMDRLNRGFVDMDIRLGKKDWYGPGRAAQAFFNRVGVATTEECAEAIPAEVLKAGQDSYFGGWFEIFEHGHVGQYGPLNGLPFDPWDDRVVYECDINSAYPYAMTEAPCWLHGEWVWDGEETTDTPYALLYATVTGSHPRIGPLPWRDRKGTVRRPMQTKGWYWEHEVRASYDAGLVSTVDIEYRLAYQPCACPKPLAEPIKELYAHRLRVGKNTAQGKAAKLVYNSGYGKKAQSVGNPKYANSLDASFITSHTRTEMLKAIAAHPGGADAVVMVATDGIYFKGSPPPVTEGSGLGEWEVKAKKNLTLFAPGIYWDDKSRAAVANGGSPQLRSRGISAAALAASIAELDRLWETFDGHEWPKLTITVPFTMVSPKQALARNQWELAGVVNPEITRAMDSDPSLKRANVNIEWDGSTRAHYHHPLIESTPYERTFGMDLAQEVDKDAFENHIDGPMKQLDLFGDGDV